MDVTPRTVGFISLGALAPAVAFIALKGETIAAITLLNVLIITGCLALALSPHEDEHHDEASANGV
ncbi:hypothetical protein [Haloarchaeobius iranensis]|uniref:DUF8131 domain-containing protein n=1 Tax=Haloarchaeobius iranensis TaxID=996166 RepID=A0A1G9XEM7_9EURY|nr:hypothetical protein [Haloarchaeobius iranensis]SDM95210.1 hypothetical protein SAMN05192554_11086 [Haloarchaeobius iranensis]